MIGFTTLTGFEKDPGRLKYLRHLGLFCSFAKSQNTLHFASVKPALKLSDLSVVF